MGCGQMIWTWTRRSVYQQREPTSSTLWLRHMKFWWEFEDWLQSNTAVACQRTHPVENNSSFCTHENMASIKDQACIHHIDSYNTPLNLAPCITTISGFFVKLTQLLASTYYGTICPAAGCGARCLTVHMTTNLARHPTYPWLVHRFDLVLESMVKITSLDGWTCKHKKSKTQVSFGLATTLSWFEDCLSRHRIWEFFFFILG